jgi:hypothetical protein
VSFIAFQEFFVTLARSDAIRFENLPEAIRQALGAGGPALSTVKSWFNGNSNMTLKDFPDVLRIMARRGFDLSGLRNYILTLFEMRPRPQLSCSRLLRAVNIHLGRIHQAEIDLSDPSRLDLDLAQQLANDLITLGEVGKELQMHIIEATSQHNPEEIEQIFQTLDQFLKGE